MQISNSTMLRFELEEKLRVGEAFQQRLVERGLIPDPRRLLIRRCRFLLEGIGGVLIGLFVGALAVLMTFLIFNKVLHIGV